MPDPSKFLYGSPFLQQITIGDRSYRGYVKQVQHQLRDYGAMDGGDGYPFGPRPLEIEMVFVVTEDMEFPPGETIADVTVEADTVTLKADKTEPRNSAEPVVDSSAEGYVKSMSEISEAYMESMRGLSSAAREAAGAVEDSSIRSWGDDQDKEGSTGEMTNMNSAPEPEEVVGQEQSRWVQELAIKRQLDHYGNNGCQVSVKAAGSFGLSEEYSSYETNRQLAWMRLLRSDKFRKWLFIEAPSEFTVVPHKCIACGGVMNRGIQYTPEWTIVSCGSCDRVEWMADDGSSASGPFTLNMPDFHVPGGEVMKYKPEQVHRTTRSEVVKKIIDKHGLTSEHVVRDDELMAGIRVTNPEDGALEVKDFVSALSILVDFIRWAAKHGRQGQHDKTQEILSGLEFALGEFLKDPDGAALHNFHIPFGPNLARIAKDIGDSPSGIKSSVRWEMSLAHIRNCIDRHTATLGQLKAALKPVMTDQHYGHVKNSDRVAVAKLVAKLENVFSGDPHQTVGKMNMPGPTNEPASEVVWGLSRLGMLVHESEIPVKKMRIGDYIRYKRMSCSLSVREVAGAIKMPPEKYRRIETGHKLPTRGDVSRIMSTIPGTDLSFALNLHGIDK